MYTSVCTAQLGEWCKRLKGTLCGKKKYEIWETLISIISLSHSAYLQTSTSILLAECWSIECHHHLQFILIEHFFCIFYLQIQLIYLQWDWYPYAETERLSIISVEGVDDGCGCTGTGFVTVCSIDRNGAERILYRLTLTTKYLPIIRTRYWDDFLHPSSANQNQPCTGNCIPTQCSPIYTFLGI